MYSFLWREYLELFHLTLAPPLALLAVTLREYKGPASTTPHAAPTGTLTIGNNLTRFTFTQVVRMASTVVQASANLAIE